MYLKLLRYYIKLHIVRTLTLLVEFIKLGDLFSSSSTIAGLMFCEQAL